MTKRAILCWMGATLCSLFLSVSAQAATLSVNCNASSGQLHTIGGALKLLDPSVPNTINVSGTCNENVVIQSFERLTLNAVNGASINDTSGFNSPVLDFEDSKGYLNGFTINGGSPAIVCSDFSQCRLQNNTIQGGFPGVSLSGQAFATFNGDSIQGGGRGLLLTHASFALLLNVSVQNNGNIGVSVSSGSTVAANGSKIQNNRANGVVVLDHGTFHMIGGTITGNVANGVSVQSASEATFQSGASITGNSGHGVEVDDLSFARFQGVSVTGNTSTDVQCNPQFSATRGALTDIGGGTTNCVEP